MSEILTKAQKAKLDREHNIMVAALSLLISGMAHIYKTPYGAGLAILLISLPFSL